MSRSSRGMTLTEVCVYCTLLSLFALMLFVNLPTRGNANAENLRAATSKADTLLERLTLELSNASASSVQTHTSPAGVLFLAATRDGFTSFTYTSTGDLAWLGWVGYFQDGNKLERVYLPLKSASARSAVTTTPSYEEMVKVGTRQVLTDDLVSFAVTSPEFNLWQLDVKLSLDGNQVALSTATGARN